MKKVLNWKIYRSWIQVLPSTNISFSSFLEEEEENLPKLNPGLDQRKDPGGVATTWHSSSTWVGHCGLGLCLVIVIVFVVLPSLLLLGSLLSLLLLSLPSLSCYLYCYCGAVYVVVIVVLSLSLFEKFLKNLTVSPSFLSWTAATGAILEGEKNEFLHYSRNPAAIIVNNQVDHQSDNNDNSQ